MKSKSSSLAQSYLTALRKHLKQDTQESLATTRKLGMRTLRNGLKSADLSKIHEKALITLVLAADDSLKTSEMTPSNLLAKSCKMQEELRLLSRRLLAVQEVVRQRINRKLHVVIAQTLTEINVRLTALKTQSTASTKELCKKIAVTQRLVEKSVDVVHRLARDLRPAVLDDLGLITALQSYMKDYMKQTGIRASLTAVASIDKLGYSARTVLFRVAQEALTNVARHAKASRANVNIHNHDGVIHMDINDNGMGFNAARVGFAKGRKRLGLLGMRERVEMVGGTFRAESAPGSETTIHVQIPLDKHCRERTTK